MALKPLFYMLTKNGPWDHHVRVDSILTMLEVENWLNSTGKVLNVDYECLIENIENKATKKTFVPNLHSNRNKTMGRAVQTVEPIIFFNDSTIATYVKLTWGGR